MAAPGNRPSKIVPLAGLAARIADGCSLALGGSFLHRGPFALVRELVRHGRHGLQIIKPSPGYDLDLLCRAGAVAKSRAGIVALEGGLGLARWFRAAVEQKRVLHEEHG